MALFKTAQVTLTEIVCGKCGGVYALSNLYVRSKEESGGFWRCPYCKCSWGYGESENDKLLKKIERLKKQKEWAEQETKNAERRRSAAIGQVTKMKNRAKAGLCPCCYRTIKQLAAHMKRKHPDYISKP